MSYHKSMISMSAEDAHLLISALHNVNMQIRKPEQGEPTTVIIERNERLIQILQHHTKKFDRWV